MAERNLLKADSIDSLIYKEKKGEFRGYRRDLLTEETPDNIKKIIFCCQCEGISRKPQLGDGKTFCTPCSKGTRTPVDSRVDEIVLQLKSRCPLSTRGCDWLGQLGDIEQHIRECEKLRIDCEIGCGEVLERRATDEHLRKCPLRRERCEFCGEEVETSKANRHIALCPIHPDGEVLCPYKELGCDLLRIRRKNLDTHLADNFIGHQKLLLKEINQLRSENDKLRNAADNSKKRDVIWLKRVWVLLAVAVIGIAILVSYLHTERDRIHVIEQSMQSNKQSIQSHDLSLKSHQQSIQSNNQFIQSHEQSIQSNNQSIQSNNQSIQSNNQSIQSNNQSIQSNKQSIQSNNQFIQSNKQSIQLHDQSIQSNKQSIQSNRQSIQSNKQSIQSHSQSMKFLVSDAFSNSTYLHDYILDRGKTLEGVEWTHRNVRGETYYGPIFYLGNCKLRLHVYVSTYIKNSRRNTNYHVTRLKGDSDDVSDTCHITYIHLYSVNKQDNNRYNVMSGSVSEELKVGEKYVINSSFFIYEDITLSTRTIRIYFDFE